MPMGWDVPIPVLVIATAAHNEQAVRTAHSNTIACTHTAFGLIGNHDTASFVHPDDNEHDDANDDNSDDNDHDDGARLAARNQEAVGCGHR